MEKIKGYKGFDKDMTCRGFQYESGKDYTYDGDIECCRSGFHFCENPLEVLSYYPPATSRFCEVEGSGNSDGENDDSKISVSNLHIGLEIGLSGLIQAGIKFILDKVNYNNNKATNTGYCSAATNTGNYSAAEVKGKESIAIAAGYNSKASGTIGCWLVLTERNSNYEIVDVKAVRVDGHSIKENTFYSLENGQIKEIKNNTI